MQGRWEDAQGKWRESIRPNEIEGLEDCKSMEQMNDELQKLYEAQIDDSKKRQIREMFPVVAIMQQLFINLACVSPPISLDSAIFWGLFRIVVKVGCLWNVSNELG